MQLDEEGFIQQRRLADGRLIAIEPLLFKRARLGIGMLPPLHEVEVYADTWEFPSLGAALLAFVKWEPEQQKEPNGWDRHAATMRYRIGGDATLEYIKHDDDNVVEQVVFAILIIAGMDCKIIEMADDSPNLGIEFPSWTHLAKTLTDKGTYNVFCCLDRCVVVAEEDEQKVSVDTIIKRLTK